MPAFRFNSPPMKSPWQSPWRPLIWTLMVLLAHCGRTDQHHQGQESAEQPPPPFKVAPQDPATDKSAEEFPDLNTKAWWLEKTVRTLRNGRSLTDHKERDDLLAKTPQEIVEQLVNEESFYDLMVDFNLYYLGIKSDKIKYPANDDSIDIDLFNILARPQALEGALLIKEGGDYFKMFSSNTRRFAKPLSGTYGDDLGDYHKDAAKYRLSRYQLFLAKLDNLILMVQQGKTPTQEEFCLIEGKPLKDFFEDLELPDGFSRSFDVPGNPFAIYLSSCRQKPFSLPPDILDPLQKARTEFAEAFTYLQTLEKAVYHPTKLSELKILDTLSLQIGEILPQKKWFSLDDNFFWFWSVMSNSSTNYNRKRASYALKRFFCDDLTPINVVAPAHHAGTNRHASEPSCQSCHYKLDPMAGFFRYHGGFGIDFKAEKFIVFDDNAQRSLADYTNHWMSQDTAHPWSIGYIRSTTDEKLNDYSDHPENPTFSDLLPLMKRSPEVKQCLVRRLFEYFVGEKQAVDPAYLEDLAKTFSDRYTADTNAAFKETVSRLVLSKTFRTADPASEECYDVLANPQETDRPPCKIAAILQKNCASCHQGSGASGHLDLTRWIPVSSQQKAFPHQDQQGRPIPMNQSFQIILDRLTSTDPEKRMPLSQHIDVADRDALFLWFNSALDGEANP